MMLKQILMKLIGVIKLSWVDVVVLVWKALSRAARDAAEAVDTAVRTCEFKHQHSSGREKWECVWEQIKGDPRIKAFPASVINFLIEAAVQRLKQGLA